MSALPRQELIFKLSFHGAYPALGIDLMFPQGGKADLVLSKSGHYLVGTYTNIWNQVRNNQTVSLTRK